MAAAAAPPSMYPPLQVDPLMPSGDDQQAEMQVTRSKRKERKRREKSDEERVTVTWESEVSANLTYEDVYELLSIMKDREDMNKKLSKWSQTMMRWRMKPGQKDSNPEELKIALDRIRPEFLASAEFKAAIEKGQTVIKPLKERKRATADPDISQASSQLKLKEASRARLDIVVLREFENPGPTLEQRIKSSPAYREHYGLREVKWDTLRNQDAYFRKNGVTIEDLERRLEIRTDQRSFMEKVDDQRHQDRNLSND